MAGPKSDGRERVERVKNAIAELIAREGFELVELELVTERGMQILRLYIDTVPPGTKEHGVTVDHCSLVSRVVGQLLDENEDLITGEYNLEVSSPGIFRPLTKLEHYERALGERVKVKTYEKLDGRKVFTGTLKGIEKETATLRLEIDGREHSVPIKSVAKANLEPVL
ncbi:ribosome maturation factor RimP [Myxococcota bacterium]|nr:ribosome maturation factor RimP [Myxococcota bacterium]